MLQAITPLKNMQFEPCIYWEGFLSEEELSSLNALPEWNTLVQATIGGETSAVVDPNVRATKIAWVKNNDSNKWLYERISEVLAKVNNLYFNFDLTGLHEYIQLGLYDENDQGHYNWHIDTGRDFGLVSRKLSFVLMLSDPSEFEGGHLEIKYDSDIPITPQLAKGRAWIFPSYLLHRVTPVTKGVRKSLVVWAGGASFK